MTPEQMLKAHCKDLKNPAYRKRLIELKAELNKISNRQKTKT